MPIYLRTGEDLPNVVKDALRNANANLSSTRNHSNYIRELTNIFGYTPRKIGLREKYFLGGFIEGDGSINVSAKKLRNAAHGIHLDPEFSITQHVNSVELLILGGAASPHLSALARELVVFLKLVAFVIKEGVKLPLSLSSIIDKV